MIIKLLKIFAVTALVTALAACGMFSGTEAQVPVNSIDIIDENSFYAQNMENGGYYAVAATMLWEGERCVIWAENGSVITQAMAQTIAREYDSVIRPKITDAFGMKNFEKDGKHFDDILDYANSLAGRTDNKLTVLLLDIQDGFKNPDTDSWVAGYFYSGNFYPRGNIGGNGNGPYSNARDMIYMDTYPGLSIRTETEETYATFAHELQHLINYVTSRVQGRTSMDTWVDEGLSSQAEYLYLGENPASRCEWFARDPLGTIKAGNNFFVWDNHRKESERAVLDDYASVYLFFRWLYLQAGEAFRSRIFYNIETSHYSDYRAVTGMAAFINPGWGSWEILLRTWLAANYYPENAYGYTGDDYLKANIKGNTVGRSSVSLYPGEGVYSVINNTFTPAAGGANIRYAGLVKNANAITANSPYREDILVTFNAGSNNTANSETGYLAASPAVPRAAADTAAARQTATVSGPYILDARDILARNLEK